MSDAALQVRFHMESRLDNVATSETGEPVWKNVEYVEIHVPGDNTNIPYRPVEEKDRKRFAKQYEAWTRGHGEVTDGQPLKMWPAITPAEVSMLAHARVYTVEQLAAVSDENASRIGPILALRDRARRHLEQSRMQAPVERLNAKLEEQQGEISSLKEELQRAIAALQRTGQAALAPEPPSAPEVEAQPEEVKAPKKPRKRTSAAQVSEAA